MRKRRQFWRDNDLLWKYFIALVIGILVGFRILPVSAVIPIYILLCGLSIYKAIQGNVGGFFSVFPFVIYTEIFIRAFAKNVPYLTLQYVLILCFSIFLIKGVRSNKSHFKGFIFLALFLCLELLNNIYPDSVNNSRAIIVNTLVLFLVAYWGSLNKLKAVDINRLLTHIKIAAIYLSGIVLVAHLQGKVDYGTVSNSDASNGMAPVQLSGYLGTGCVLFFLSIMNPEEAKHRLINICLLGFTTTIMVLTFSRGGLYFLVGIIGLYLYYNKHKLGSYFKFIFLLPVAMLIYHYVVDQTGGKIVERYEQEGTSNRDVLVGIGFELFLRHPLTGVGTGNYNTSIVKEKLFDVESGAHNEFVRAAAEHGIFGIIIYWGFFIVLFFEIKKRGQPQQQFAMYFFALFCLITVHNGLKISLQPFLLLLAISIAPRITYIRKNGNNLVNQHAKRAIA